jgi:drug/metabolite transporter (DMT)-like permease
MLVGFLLLGMGVLALLAQFGITKAFTTGNAAKVSVVNLTQVVFAMIFDIFCFGHPIDLVRFVGMSLILVPTAWLIMERARTPTDGKPDRMGAKQPSHSGESDDETRSEQIKD